MPKMKTRKSAASRYRVTAGGKVMIKNKGTRHILTKKSQKRKRRLRHPGAVSSVEVPRIRKLLPYN